MRHNSLVGLLTGLVAVVLAFCAVIFVVLPYLVHGSLPGLAEDGSLALPFALPSAGKFVAGVLALGACGIGLAKMGAVARVQGLTSGLRERASTSLSVFLRRVKEREDAAPARPAASVSHERPCCGICGARGETSEVLAPLLMEAVRVCLDCARRFPSGAIDWARLAPGELDAVLSDARLAPRLGLESFLLGVAHLYEERKRLPSLLERPLFAQPEPAARLAHALEVLGDYALALTLLVRKKAFSREDFLLFFRLHQKNGSIAQVSPDVVPVPLRADFAEALLESGETEKARKALDRIPPKDWGRRGFALALRLAERVGTLAAAEAVLGAAEKGLHGADLAELRYSFALLCEKAGQLARAKGVYTALGAFRDAPERLRSLDSVSEEEAKAVSDMPALSAAPSPSPGASAFVPAGSLLHQRYRIVKTLGRGAMGFVFLGHDLKRDQPVAVKRVASYLTSQESYRKALYREAEAAAGLEPHAGIARILKVITTGTRIDIVTEYVDGEPLSEVLARRGRLPPDECMVFARMLLAALGWAHAKGVLHRGLKPGNVMKGRDGRLKVLDFGIARGYGPGAGLAGPHLAPEQHAGKATARSDLFAFGATLYELLAGEPPFGAEGGLGLKMQEAYAPLSEDVPVGLRGAVKACLRSDPERRPSATTRVDALLRGAPSAQ